MAPNINQPIGTNAMQQAAPAPKKGMGKGIILLIVLILLVLGMAGYVLFAKNQLNNTQKTTTGSTSSDLSTPTSTPTPLPEDDLEVSSPEADLIDLEADIEGL